MTEENIFVYKSFGHYIFQVLVYFYVKTATLLDKGHPSFPANPSKS